MTTAEYAQHRGCSDSYVRRMRRDGRLILAPDGKRIDVVASDALLAETSDPVRGGDRTGKPAPVDAQGAPTAIVAPLHDRVDLREAMRRERLAKARAAELSLGEQSGALTRTHDVRRDTFTLARQAMERLRRMGSKLRLKLAAESDPHACEQLINDEVARISEEMQKAAHALTQKRPMPTEDAA
ncbi:hypothetical protein FKV25_01990 [Lysobacter aestuarii]|uniref:Terminase small subunit n=2 Tax=Marilutibacter aestuarii TaxID=1706195 RepID=A0A508AP71_9GAMM|nr:hypothetical protein FKV25_01990 [Lysobacter aestuarii]